MEQNTAVEFVLIEPANHAFNFVQILAVIDFRPVLESEVLDLVVPVEGVSEFIAG